MERKVVALIDCQNDFIDGTLGVGHEKWSKAWEYISEKLLPGTTDLICTKDYHPHNHCSFKKFGGIWPEHCIAESHGAELYWKLQDFIEEHGNIVCSDLLKAQTAEKEEYGVDVLRDLDDLTGIECVHLAGLCTDYCVKESALVTAIAHPDINIAVHLGGSAFIEQDSLDLALKQMKRCENIILIKDIVQCALTV